MCLTDTKLPIAIKHISIWSSRIKVGRFLQKVTGINFSLRNMGEWRGQTFVSGYPKLDVYRTEKVNACGECSENKPQNKSKCIIWAPHWSIRDKFLSYSTFDKIYKSFLEYAKTSLFIEWIFKPHQRLRYHCVESGFLTKNEIDEYYDSWERLSNAKLYNDPNYFDIFKTSDALITDCGSFLAEYLPTKNPVLLLLNEDSVGYNEIGNKIVINYYKAKKLRWYCQFYCKSSYRRRRLS